MRITTLAFFMIFGVLANALNIAQNDIIDNGLYIPAKDLKYSYDIGTEVINLDIKNDFSIFSDITLQNLTNNNAINLFTYGNQSVFYEFDILYQGRFYIAWGYSSTYFPIAGYNDNYIPIPINNYQIVLTSKNNTLSLQINNIPLIIEYPSNQQSIPLPEIENGKFWIQNNVFGLNNPSYSYNRLLVYNTSLNNEDINNLKNNQIDNSNLILYYDFQSQNNPLTDKTAGVQLYKNNTNVAIISTTYSKDIFIAEYSVLQKINYGIVQIIIIVNSFNNLNITLNINRQNFDCELINQQINSSLSYLTLTTLFNCDISLNDVGTFPIYISIDQGISYYQLPQDFTVYQYVDNSISGTTVTQNALITATTSNENTILILILAGLGTGFFIVALLIFLMKCTKNKKIRERLIKLDLLYITLRHKKIEEIKENTRDAYLGLGNTYYIRSTMVGGLLTIYLIIIAIFFAIAYLNDTYQNNVEINTYLGTSNGKIITNGFINAKITFNELLYGTCDNLCSNWVITSDNLQNNVVTSCTETKITNILSNCAVAWSCTNCNTQINTDSIISFILTAPNVGFKSFDYEIDINSYQQGVINSLSGSVVPDANTLLISESVVSIISNPTALSDGGVQTAGYSLDYLSLAIGNTIDLSNLSNINPRIVSTYVSNIYNVNFVGSNTIGVGIKISQNPSWLFITKSQKSSFFTIFFQLISILISLFGLAKITLNLITKKRILKCILNIVNCGKPNKKKNVKDNSLSDVRVVDGNFGGNVNNDIGMATLKNSPAKDTIIDEEMSVSINV